MARRKKGSRTLTKAERRLAGIKSIDAKLDLGNGISTTWYEKEVAKLRQAVEAYNVLLSKVDDASNNVEAAEKQLATASENVLLGVKIKFGKDSSQYEMAGGTRLSEHRRKASQPESQLASELTSQPIEQPTDQPALAVVHV